MINEINPNEIFRLIPYDQEYVLYLYPIIDSVLALKLKSIPGKLKLNLFPLIQNLFLIKSSLLRPSEMEIRSITDNGD